LKILNNKTNENIGKKSVSATDERKIFKNNQECVILNSSLQIALGLFPILVLLSFFLGGTILSFVLSPLLPVCLALSVIVSAFIVFDGESIWMEGLALIGLCVLLAAAFWWG
jgi:Ca2+:H+ antiporter